MSDGGMLRVVVVGSGRVGLQTVRMLDARGHDVIVIERNPERCKQIMQEYVATVIEGDAGRPSILRQADLAQRDVVVAATNTPTTNLAVCMTAKRIAPGIITVMRTTIENSKPEYEEFVDHVVFPEEAGARTLVNAVQGGVRSIEEISGDVEIIQVEVAEGAPAAGKSLAEVRLPKGSLIVVDYEGNRIGGADTVLEPGHHYIIAVEADVIDEVINLLRG